MGQLKSLTDPMFDGIVVDVTHHLSEFWIPEKLRTELGSGLSLYVFGPYTSHESRGGNGNVALFPNQYLAYACKMHDQAMEIIKYFDIFHKIRSHCSSFLGDHTHIENAILGNPVLKDTFSDASDISLMAHFLDKENSEYRFGAKDLFNDQGEARPAKDVFKSAVLKKINLPNANSEVFGNIVYDLASNSTLFDTLRNYYIKTANISVVQSARNFPYAALPKPFLLLAGISGTGKTRFVREQASASGSLEETYALVPVRPDWHEPSDMLGYVSRIGKQPQFIVTDVLKFMVKAWKAIYNAGFELNGKHTKGPIVELDKIPPYWLCLDEMNLAPVEQYFADYLAILETREWKHEAGFFTYQCDPIVKPSILSEFSDMQPETPLREHLELQGPDLEELWQHFCKNGIALPFNLIVAGTVNMDETTHGFSRKVIDRALSLDFGEYYPNHFNEFFEPTTEKITFTYPHHSDGRNKLQLASTADANGTRSIDFLEAVNESLKGTAFQLAYRALNELLLAVIATQPQDDLTLQAVWDDFIMSKVLPRIEGDNDKLMVPNGTSAEHGADVLEALNATLGEKLSEVWSTKDQNTLDTRPDLHRRLIVASAQTGNTKLIPCRTKRKLAWMQRRLESATYTSFWP